MITNTFFLTPQTSLPLSSPNYPKQQQQKKSQTPQGVQNPVYKRIGPHNCRRGASIATWINYHRPDFAVASGAPHRRQWRAASGPLLWWRDNLSGPFAGGPACCQGPAFVRPVTLTAAHDKRREILSSASEMGLFFFLSHLWVLCMCSFVPIAAEIFFIYFLG